MRSSASPRFWRAHAALPSSVQEQAREAFRRFQRDPFHDSLRFKEVSPLRRLWSVRVGLHYRALAQRNGDQVDWFWIGSHADYDRLIG